MRYIFFPPNGFRPECVYKYYIYTHIIYVCTAFKSYTRQYIIIYYIRGEQLYTRWCWSSRRPSFSPRTPFDNIILLVMEERKKKPAVAVNQTSPLRRVRYARARRVPLGRGPFTPEQNDGLISHCGYNILYCTDYTAITG